LSAYSDIQIREVMAERDRLREENARLFDEMELAWGIIANAGGNGDWSKESKEWQDAAQRWRGRYFVLAEARQR
jgi:hypothetical protein